ncbi:MAG: hypothetical protein JSU08_02325 [Acidobacteria bacterium]|nr:hypothetical protein [Acidobacteriota bacterium]
MRPCMVVAWIALGLAPAAAAQPPSFVMAACAGEATHVADVRLPHAVLADGKALPAGAYEVRATAQHPSAVPGADAQATCWVQFLQGGELKGRELATVVSEEDARAIAKGPVPARNAARVDQLKGGDYYRIWINADGTHYIINLPPVQTGP